MDENAARIDYAQKFLKQLKKAPLEIKVAFRKRLELFLKDPFHPLLDNHGLTGQYTGFRSINVTGDWRAIFAEQKSEAKSKTIVFVIIGTHSQLYK